MGRVPQTERNINILRDHSRGMKPQELAKKYNITQAVVYNVIKLASDSFWDPQPDGLKNSMIRMYNEDYDSQYIADSLDITVPEVIGFLLYIHKTPNDPGWGDNSRPIKVTPIEKPQESKQTTAVPEQMPAPPRAEVVKEISLLQLSNAKRGVDVDFCAESTADILSEKSNISDEVSLLDAVAEYISKHWNDNSATSDVLLLLHAYGRNGAIALYIAKCTGSRVPALGEAVRVGKAYIELLDEDGYVLAVKEN